MRPKLGIVAGGGTLPQRLAEICRTTGRDYFVLAIEGQTAAATTEAAPHAWVRLGAVGRALDVLREAGVSEVVLAGPVGRPTLADIRPDFVAAKMIGRIGKAALSDDGMLTGIIKLLEEEGFQVVGAEDVFTDLLAPLGPLGQLAPDAAAAADIALGVEVARALGAHDVGQAVVVQQGVVLGVEAVEGTDALIKRAGDLARAGHRPVLVKVRKPQQERRADLPTIGVATIQNSAAARFCGVAIEAGGSLVLDRSALVKAADAAGLFVLGVRVPG
jgi:UDP-2,3-diacylglucosamine hydrolase